MAGSEFSDEMDIDELEHALNYRIIKATTAEDGNNFN